MCGSEEGEERDAVFHIHSSLIVAAIFKCRAGDAVVLFIARSAGLGCAHPKPATSEPMPLRVSSVDEMGTDESHCQSGKRRSHGGERHVY